MSAEPDSFHVTSGAWLPRLEAARCLGISERTIQRRIKQGLVMTRHDEHGRLQVYVEGAADTRHDQGHDMAVTTTAGATMKALAEMLGPAMLRNAEQEAIIRQQAEEIGTLRAQLATQATPWWRVLWQRVSGHVT